MKTPKLTILERIKRYYSAGAVAGFVLLFWIIFGLFLNAILCVFQPADKIEPAVDFPYIEYAENKEKYGDYRLDERLKGNN